jgi:hypothetical protein
VDVLDGATHGFVRVWGLADELAARYPELPAAQICSVMDRAYQAATAVGTADARTVRQFAGDRLDVARARNAAANRVARTGHREGRRKALTPVGSSGS